MKAKLKLYSPHEAQLKFHESNARYRVASYGRQAGKSTACLNELLRHAWIKPGSVFWFVSPTYEQAKQQYRRLIGMLSPCWEVLLKKNQTELRIKLINQSEIVFKSGEVSHNLRGATLHGVVIDEVRDQPADLWTQVIRPMIATTGGWAAFVSTPNGFDGFYDLFDRAGKHKDWESFQAPSSCNPLWTSEEMEAARQEMSELEFRQEILAEFVDLAQGKAYLNHGAHNQSETNPFAQPGERYSPWLPIVVGMDFNVTPIAWTLGQQKFTHWHWVEEINLKNSHTQEATKELIERVKGHKAGIVIVGDASGHARKTSAAGQTDYSIVMEALSAAGIKCMNKTPEANPAVKDRVNLINSKLKSADGTVYLTYDPRACPNLKKDFERVAWKQGANAILDQHRDPTLTHQTDSVGYPIYALSDSWKPKVGQMRVINRSF